MWTACFNLMSSIGLERPFLVSQCSVHLSTCNLLDNLALLQRFLLSPVINTRSMAGPTPKINAKPPAGPASEISADYWQVPQTRSA